MTKAAFVAQNEVVAPEIKLLEGVGVEGEIELLPAVCEGQFVDEAGADIPVLPMGGHFSRGVKGGVEWGLGKQIHQIFQNIFCSPDLVHPIMNECDFQ
jgi:hypothetical protein